VRDRKKKKDTVYFKVCEIHAVTKNREEKYRERECLSKQYIQNRKKSEKQNRLRERNTHYCMLAKWTTKIIGGLSEVSSLNLNQETFEDREGATQFLISN